MHVGKGAPIKNTLQIRRLIPILGGVTQADCDKGLGGNRFWALVHPHSQSPFAHHQDIAKCREAERRLENEPKILV